LIDGTEFDSSYKRGKPTTFAPNQVIKGWTEAMQLMKEGDKWQLFIPSELAYGDSQRGQFITPGAVLLFDIEIIKVKSGGYVKSEL
jgi:FKBP-type peptidyl-prolyl cis-trans isomerase FklB